MWKEYPPDKNLWQGHSRFWQECLMEIDEEKVFADIVEYLPFPNNPNFSYELHIQIPERISITKKTINIIIFTYNKVDFKRMGRDALKVIKRLTNKI